MNDRETASVSERNGQIGVVFALGIEAGGFVDTLDNVVSKRDESTRIHSGDLHGIPVTVMETGVGCSRARESVRQLLDARALNWIVSAGFAGSLTAELPRGDFLIADALVDNEGSCLALDFRMNAADTSGLHVGRLLTIDGVVQKSQERRRLAEKHQAVAVDMESYAIADVCRCQGVRFFSVRVISDGVDEDIPLEVAYLLRQESTAARLGAAAGAVLKRPSSARDLWRLRERAVSDSERLAKFLEGVIDQLHQS